MFAVYLTNDLLSIVHKLYEKNLLIVKKTIPLEKLSLKLQCTKEELYFWPVRHGKMFNLRSKLKNKTRKTVRYYFAFKL